MDKIIVFLVTWSLVSIVTLVSSAIFKFQIVLGNADISGSMAAVVWSLVFTYTCKNSPKILSKLELKIKDVRYSIIVSTVILLPLIWTIKKFAHLTGVGISNNLFVLILAVIISVTAFYSFKYSEFYLKKIQ